MDKYEQLSVVGEGSYGVVLKCRRRDNGELVAIKKFLETEDDLAVRKMALREIRMLKKLRHDHLVNMIEVFRRKRRYYLVFEYLEHTLLDELEASPGGLGEDTAKKYLYQLLKGIDYCHQNSIIHRDVKPENVLVSTAGIVKLCDLGFARAMAAPGEPYTEYVATRWYRAPELLVADHRYGSEVDIWAVGCIFAEMLTGDPLFPGDSDIDQLALIIKTIGKLAPRHQHVVSRLSGGSAALEVAPRAALPAAGYARELMAACLRTEPRARPTAQQLLKHKYFIMDGFAENFKAELKKKLGKHTEVPPTTRVAKPRQQWTLNVKPDPNRTRTNSTTGSLIDYNFTPGGETPMEASIQKPPDTDRGTEQIASADGERASPPLPAPPRCLIKAINDTFKSFPIPITNYPRTPYIKKVNNRLEMDPDVLNPKSKKTVKNNTTDLTLPYVPGASNSPVKRAKKPHSQASHKKRENYDDAHPGSNLRESAVSARAMSNLPYMVGDPPHNGHSQC